MNEGIKHDSGKLRLAEMMQDFREPLSAVCRVWEFGADKYEKSNWQKVDNALDRYTNAMLRHLMEEQASDYDRESYLLHAAHVAWNALARLHFILKDKTVLDGVATLPGMVSPAWFQVEQESVGKPGQQIPFKYGTRDAD
jgi:hypothetical protein